MALSSSESSMPIRQMMAPEETELRICSAHGPYTAKKFYGHWSMCEACFDAKIKQEVAEDQAKIAVERQNLKIQQVLNRAGIPERFSDRSFDNYRVDTEDQGKRLAVCRSYAEKFPELVKRGQSMIFLGKTGTGKTHLAIAIAHQVIAQGYTAAFMTVGDCLRRVRDTWKKNSEVSESSILDDLGRIDLLILDEVGVQYGTDAEKILLFDLLNRRYENRKPVIMLTNLPLEAAKSGDPTIVDFLGERIIDRLRENGGKVLKFTWESYRREVVDMP